MKHKIYLDYNATSPLRPAARAAIIDILSLENAALNASSTHHFGQKGRKIVENARHNIANLINAEDNQVIFNSGATEGNNTVIHHFTQNYPDEVILISEAEHPSILDSAQKISAVKTIPVDKNGLLKTDILETLLNDHKTSLVSCMAVNNETGIIQNIIEISALAHKHNALFHCDATQALGRITIDMKESGIDFLTLSAHKIGGPQGIGALALGLCGQTPTLIFGGGQEKSARAGTENVAGIAGFGAAANDITENEHNTCEMRLWRDNLEEQLKQISPEIIIHGATAHRVPNTSFFSLPNINAQTLLMALDLEGIAISNGSACSSGTIKPSTTLKAMGCPENIAANALRISMGWATTKEDLDSFISIWKRIMSKQRKNK